MILSASRRTDIPAFYSEWFFNRLRAGMLRTRNPYNYHQVYQIDLASENIDCLVFWTKNAEPMLSKLDLLQDYSYYFQYTITPYPKAYEPNLDELSQRIETFIKLAEKIGPDHIIWRYDPIFMADDIDVQFHLRMFEQIALSLANHTFRCIISFIDLYNSTKRNIRDLHIAAMDDRIKRALAQELASIAKDYQLEMHTCAERIDLADLGIPPGRCIDDKLISRLTNKAFEGGKDPHQRAACGCIKSFDIGVYNTCLTGCKYCYATRNHQTALKNRARHDPLSPFLIGNSADGDQVKII